MGAVTSASGAGAGVDVGVGVGAAGAGAGAAGVGAGVGVAGAGMGVGVGAEGWAGGVGGSSSAGYGNWKDGKVMGGIWICGIWKTLGAAAGQAEPPMTCRPVVHVGLGWGSWLARPAFSWQGLMKRKLLCTEHEPWLYCTLEMPLAVPVI